jgi:hypothetical protein
MNLALSILSAETFSERFFGFVSSGHAPTPAVDLEKCSNGGSA